MGVMVLIRETRRSCFHDLPWGAGALPGLCGAETGISTMKYVQNPTRLASPEEQAGDPCSQRPPFPHSAYHFDGSDAGFQGQNRWHPVR